ADFTLPSAAIALDQVVVVGYGSELRKDLTGSVGSVSSQDIAKIPVARIDQAISGLVPGVQIQTTNAAPGSDSIRVRVRGSNSLQASNEPLVVVDGDLWNARRERRHPGDDQAGQAGANRLRLLRLHRRAGCEQAHRALERP